MLPEITLEQWLQAGLNAYKAQPLLTEYLFLDDSQIGLTENLDLAPGSAMDPTKRWLVNSFAGGLFRFGGTTFPITANTADGQLTLEGDPTTVADLDGFGWRLVHPSAVKFIDYLATHAIPIVHTSYTQIPTEMPCFTIHLQEDMNSARDAFWNESQVLRVSEGIEYQENLTYVSSQYMVSVWGGYMECAWLYAFLLNYYEASIQLLSGWGFTDLGMSGTAVHPAQQFLPEQKFVKAFVLRFLRPERAVNLLTLQAIDNWRVEADVQYQMFDIHDALPS